MKKAFGIFLGGALMAAPHIVSAQKTGAPVETKPPNMNYKPAFAGQTRIGSVEKTANAAFALPRCVAKPHVFK